MQCKDNTECKSFLHQPTTQKCWLNEDSTFEPEVASTYVGQSECDAGKCNNYLTL